MPDTLLHINLKNLKENIKTLKASGNVKNKSIIAVVKSDAYGHGLDRISQTLAEEGIKFFGVADIHEAGIVLKNAPASKVLLLKGVSEADAVDAIKLGISIAAVNAESLEFLSEKAKKLGRTVNIHLKYDSGMNRLGLCLEELPSILDIIAKKGASVNIEGLFSHFSMAGNNLEYTKYQLENYKKAIELVNKRGVFPLYTHISASSSLLNDKISEDFSNTVRPGISMYGINPNDENRHPFKPLMSLKSTVVQVKTVKKGGYISYNNTFKAAKDMKIAVIAAGYDNGIPRLLSNNGRFIINDKFAPITGIVTMNLTMTDVTRIENVNCGSEAIIMGGSPSMEITAGEIAANAQTIPYEIFLNLGKSNRKTYV